MNQKITEAQYWNLHKDERDVDKGSFEPFYERFLHVVQSMVSIHAESLKETAPELSESLQTALIRQWQRISLRTLIFEMKVCERFGELGNGSKKEKYSYYAGELLQSEPYLRQLYKDYPVLYECLMLATSQAVSSIGEAIERFAADKEGINRRFFPDCPAQRIQTLNGGESDSHKGGRKVYILELDNGEKLVYKPRSLRVDEAWEAFLQWVTQNIGVPYWWNKAWNRGEYGWCGWVEAKTCQTYEELEKYYLRNGILLCISYLLGTEDLHYENLIAHGEYPVVVDLEMAVGSRGNRGADKSGNEAERVFRESVLQTGLLPLYAWNEEGEGVNVGAINGNGGQLVPLSMPVIVQTGTTDMHIEYRQPTMGEGKNLATWKGTFIEPVEFLEKIETGFADAYRFLMENKKEAAKRLDEFRNAPMRYLIRDTQQYAMLLLTAYGPDYLVDQEARRAILKNIEYIQPGQGSEGQDWITRKEIEALQRDDIPYFWYDIWETSLHSGDGEAREGYFQAPAIRYVEGRWERLNEDDLRRQQKMIRAALSMGAKTQPKKNIERKGAVKAADRREGAAENKGREPGLPEGQAGTAIAEKIGDIILEEAIWSENRQAVGWISIVMAGYGERSCLIRPMNPYLYDGLAGVAVFFAALAYTTQKKKYEEAARILTKDLFAHTDRMQETGEGQKFLTGAYSGEASIAYAYLLLHSIQENDVLLGYLYKQCQVLAKMFPYDLQYDVLGGNAGAILVLLSAYGRTGARQYLLWAKEAGECLLGSGTEYDWGMGWVNPVAKTALTGFSHGASGMMLAFAKLGYYTGEKRFHEAAYQAYKFEQHYYEKERHDWKDLRDPEGEEQEGGVAWCHGRGGILAARKIAARYADGNFKRVLEENVREVSSYLEDELKNKGYCLCHGKCGAASLLPYIGMEEAAAKHGQKILEEFYDYADNMKELLALQECENYGLMGGMAGIGYACLVGLKKAGEILFISEPIINTEPFAHIKHTV